MKFVFECESVVLAPVGIVVAGGFDILLNPVHLFVNLMVLVEEASKVSVIHFEVMNCVFVLWEFVDEVVFLYCHNFDS